MHKTAFIFPGQGAQYIGMGKDFYENFEESREVFEIAKKATELDIAKLCFEENEQLNQTEYTQICMLTTEAAILKAIEKRGIKASVCAGLSLGEYGALIAANVLSLEDAFKLIRTRGILMQNAYPSGGAMSAVLGMDAKQIEQICADTALENPQEIVSIANYNCPGQIVITGSKDAVALAGTKCAEEGAKRVVPLKVSGPFHSKLLEQAGKELGEFMQDMTFQTPVIPYVANVTSQYCTDKDQIKHLLEQQVAAPVRWQQSVERMIADGVDTFIEIGPGRTLSGFIKKINREVTVMKVENLQDFDALIHQL
ncbi:MAG: ACP S-malonyltransferase [Clostridia bacterium]|nr:ACP S-malonyltransferase [Clostridia bacterium]